MCPGRRPSPSQLYTPSTKHLNLKQPSPETTQPGHTCPTRVQFKPPKTQKPQTVPSLLQIKNKNQNQKPSYTHIYTRIHTQEHSTKNLKPKCRSSRDRNPKPKMQTPNCLKSKPQTTKDSQTSPN